MSEKQQARAAAKRVVEGVQTNHKYDPESARIIIRHNLIHLIYVDKNQQHDESTGNL